MKFKYGLDERPPFLKTVLYGIQWFAVTIPIIIVIGKITGALHFASIGDQMAYLQRLVFVMAAALLAQLMLGHRMPLIVGPSSILLIGIIAAAGHHPDTIYTSILLGGLILAIVSVTGLFGRLKTLFSPRVVAAVPYPDRLHAGADHCEPDYIQRSQNRAPFSYRFFSVHGIGPVCRPSISFRHLEIHSDHLGHDCGKSHLVHDISGNLQDGPYRACRAGILFLQEHGFPAVF